MDLLQHKLVWSFVEGKTRWAHYMQSKYGDKTHKIPTYASHIWSMTMPKIQFIKDNSKWLIGNGHLNISQQWLDYYKFPQNNHLTVKDYIQSQEWFGDTEIPTRQKSDFLYFRYHEGR